MANYRVLCGDLVGGANQIREELAIHDLKWSKVLNGPGSFSGWISLDDKKATRLNLDPGATCIYIERGGLLVWGGILWTAQVDNVDRKLNLGGEGFWSYFRHRLIKNRTSMTHSAIGNVDTYFPTSDTNKSANLGAGTDGVNFWANVNHKNFNPFQAIFNTDAGNPYEYEAGYSGIPTGFYSGLSIVGVRVNLVGSANPGNATGFPALRIGGTTYTAPGTYALQPTNTTLSYMWTTNPATGLAWTGANIEAFQQSSGAGFKFAQSSLPYDTRINNLWIEVIWGAAQTPVFLAVDQLSIAQDLINNSLAQPGSLGPITVGTELTTDNGGAQIVRDRTYHTYERKVVGTAVEELGAALNGFDFGIEVAWDTAGTTPVRTLHLYYPRRGTRIDGLVFNHNVLGNSKIGNSVDATQLANSIDAIGQGDGEAMLIAPKADTSLLTRYPLLEDIFSAKDVSDATLLASQAAAQVARRKLPVETPTISKTADSVPQLGTFQEGDEGLVVMSDGWINFNGYMRVMSFEVQVDDQGQETVTPTFISSDQSVN